MKKILIICQIFIIIGLIIGITYVSNNYFNHLRDIDNIIQEPLNGVIIKSKSSKKGSQFFEVQNRESNKITKFDLIAASFFQENNIQIGDSISKVANSRIILFFKLNNSIYEKCCELEIDM